MNEFFERLSKFLQSFRPWVIIEPWEQGVRVRLGKHTKLLHAGVHLRIPFVDEVYAQSTRLRTVNLTTQTITSKDGKVLTLSAALSYQIKDMLKLYNTLQAVENTLGNMALGIIADLVTQSESVLLDPVELGQKATSKLNAKHYGLDSFQVFVTDFAFVRTYRLMQEGWRGEFGNYLEMEEKR